MNVHFKPYSLIVGSLCIGMIILHQYNQAGSAFLTVVFGALCTAHAEVLSANHKSRMHKLWFNVIAIFPLLYAFVWNRFTIKALVLFFVIFLFAYLIERYITHLQSKSKKSKQDILDNM